MTGQPFPDAIADPAPPRAGLQDAPGRAAELRARQCTRCGAVGTHYLTCPGLRLPPGYRLSADPGPERGRPAGSRGRYG
jgi:hypothetical protein